jgi:cell division protein FtsB
MTRHPGKDGMKKHGQIPWLRLFIIAGGGVALAFVLMQYTSQRRQLSYYERENERLKKENAALSGTLEKSTHPYEVEKTARNQLRMMKPDEYRIEFKDKEHVSH